MNRVNFSTQSDSGLHQFFKSWEKRRGADRAFEWIWWSLLLSPVVSLGVAVTLFVVVWLAMIGKDIGKNFGR